MIFVPMRTDNDCMRCCLASILERPYECVPDFFDYDDDNPEPGWAHVRSWLWSQKSWLMCLTTSGTDKHENFRGPYIWLGTPRGRIDDTVCHAVLMEGGKLLFDPRPGGKGVTVFEDGTNVAMFVCHGRPS